MPPLALTSRPRRCDRILAQSTAGTTVLLSVDGGQYYSLDEVGSRIWELSDGARTLGEIVAILTQEYGTEPARVEADALELLAEMAHENLVETLP